jgi:Icc-related predicted phosphoesterase
VCERSKVGFVGTKGFCGGFGSSLVQPFGEAALKKFIRTSIDEAANLESCITQLQGCEHKVVILHYAPIRETLEGEPPELFPFLGTSRLANAIDPHGADVILHGHAHQGSPSGKTPGNIPVYNVSRFVQMTHTGKPYCMIDLP